MTRTPALMCVVLLAGCAAFRGGNLDGLTAWPPEAAEVKKSIGMTITGIKGEHVTTWAIQAGKAYYDAGLCSRFTCPPEGGEDLQVELAIEHADTSSGLLNFLSLITLTIIPTRSIDEYEVVTTLKDKNGKALGTVTATESVTIWQELLLLFLTPFKSPAKVLEKTYYDITRASILAARAKKLL